MAEPQIKRILKKYPHATLSDIQNISYAGSGCGRCIPLIQKIIDDFEPNTENPQGKLF